MSCSAALVPRLILRVLINVSAGERCWGIRARCITPAMCFSKKLGFAMGRRRVRIGSRWRSFIPRGWMWRAGMMGGRIRSLGMWCVVISTVGCRRSRSEVGRSQGDLMLRWRCLMLGFGSICGFCIRGTCWRHDGWSFMVGW